MNESKKPAAINWRSMAAKREADLVTFRVAAVDILAMRRTVKVLSFPSTSWRWETSLAEVFQNKRFLFTGVERDPAAYRKAAKSQPDGTTLIKADVMELFRDPSGRRTYDIIYLDWMGTWSKEKQANINALFSVPGRLNDGGLLLLTLALTRGRHVTLDPLEQMAQDLPFVTYDARGRNKHTSSFKVKGIPAWIAQAAEERGVKLRPLMANVYYSSTGLSTNVTPQVQFLFLKEK